MCIKILASTERINRDDTQLSGSSISQKALGSIPVLKKKKSMNEAKMVGGHLHGRWTKLGLNNNPQVM